MFFLSPLPRDANDQATESPQRPVGPPGRSEMNRRSFLSALVGVVVSALPIVAAVKHFKPKRTYRARIIAYDPTTRLARLDRPWPKPCPSLIYFDKDGAYIELEGIPWVTPGAGRRAITNGG